MATRQVSRVLIPRYTLSTVRDGRTINQEILRAINDDQARGQAQLRLMRLVPGDVLVLTFTGVECGRWEARSSGL